MIIITKKKKNFVFVIHRETFREGIPEGSGGRGAEKSPRRCGSETNPFGFFAFSRSAAADSAERRTREEAVRKTIRNCRKRRRRSRARVLRLRAPRGVSAPEMKSKSEDDVKRALTGYLPSCTVRWIAGQAQSTIFKNQPQPIIATLKVLYLSN